MSLESCYDSDMKRLGEQLADGAITVREYNRAVDDLKQDMVDFAKSGVSER